LAVAVGTILEADSLINPTKVVVVITPNTDKELKVMEAEQVGDLHNNNNMVDIHSLVVINSSSIIANLKDMLRILRMILISLHLSNSNRNSLHQEDKVGSSGKARVPDEIHP